MCGIVGLFEPGGLDPARRAPEHLHRMLRKIDNRGPDGFGLYESPSVSLGHSRLSIIDIEGGAQPMVSACGRYTIVYNGEIFNYVELRAELEAKGLVFRTSSDTEVLLNGFVAEGPGILDKLNGQFAFALYDRSARSLFLARDRVGILPLYYTWMEKTLAFASSIKSLLAHPGVSNEVNEAALASLGEFWSTIGPETFLKQVRALEPGCWLQYDAAGVTQRRYWDLAFPAEPRSVSVDDAVSELRQLLADAVSVRLRADVPVNVYLSGGLDSSIVSALCSQLHRGLFATYSVAFADPRFDESPFQQELSRHLGIENFSRRVDDDAIAAVFEKVVFHAEQPVYRTAPGPLYYLSGLVHGRDHRVVLTGEGSDEIAWGYDLFRETEMRYRLSGNSDPAAWSTEISNLYPYLEQFDARYASVMAGFYMKTSEDKADPLFSHRPRIQNGRFLTKFLSDRALESIKQVPSPEERLRQSLPDAFHRFTPCQKAQYLEMKTYLPGYLLSSQGDRMLMAHSVEGRFPFLDHRVIEFFARLPQDLKIRDGVEKFLLKKSFEPILPSSITTRRKYPYRAPEARPLLSCGELESLITESALRDCGVFRPDVVLRLAAKLRSYPNNFNENMVMVIVFGMQLFCRLTRERFAVADAAPLSFKVHLKDQHG